MDIYNSRVGSGGRNSWPKRFESFFRSVFLITSAFFAVLIIVFWLDKSNTLADKTSWLAIPMVVTWFGSFGFWIILLVANGPIGRFFGGSIGSASSKSKKIGRIFLFIWLLDILLAILLFYLSFKSPQDNNLMYAAIGTFLVFVILLPAWGFLLGNKIVKIVSITPPVLLVVFFLTYLFIMRPHKLTGNLMEPSIKNGTYFVTEKVSYYFFKPKRGDIIVYNSYGSDRVGRIVGLPGEKIQIVNKQILINGVVQNEPYANWDGYAGSQFEVTLEDGEYWAPFDVRRDDGNYYSLVKNSSIGGKLFFIYWVSKSQSSQSSLTGFGKIVDSTVSCKTLGTKLVITSQPPNYHSQIGCDIEAVGQFDLSKSYCEGIWHKQKVYLVPDAYGRANRYYATLTDIDPIEPAQVFIYSLSGEKIECLPKLNANSNT